MKPKYIRPQVEVECDYCHTKFQKDESEHTRNKKLGRRNYCSRYCLGKDNISNIPEDKRGDISCIPLEYRYKGDEFTGLRTFIIRANRRQEDKPTITVQYLKDVWDRQSGICPYSGVKMILPYYKGKNDPIYTASLDRIDSSKPYEEGNLQFTSAAMNYMKSTMSHERTIELCKIIASNYGVE